MKEVFFKSFIFLHSTSHSSCQPKFFKIPQNDGLFYTLLYIFQNSIELYVGKPHIEYFALRIFCETYQIPSEKILYFLNEILEADVGLFRIPWQADLFFHEYDLIGTLFFNSIQFELEKEIVNRNIHFGALTNFSQMVKNIINSLRPLRVVWVYLETQIQLLLFQLIILKAIERGFTRVELVDYWVDFAQINQTVEGIELIKKLFDKLPFGDKLIILQKYFIQNPVKLQFKF